MMVVLVVVVVVVVEFAVSFLCPGAILVLQSETRLSAVPANIREVSKRFIETFQIGEEGNQVLP